MRNFIFCLVFILFCHGKKSKIADFSVNRKKSLPTCSIYSIVGTFSQGLELVTIHSHCCSPEYQLFPCCPNIAEFLISVGCVVAVQATWMAYDMVVMRTNPDLANSMRRLEDAFLNCKEEMEKNWQEMLKETKGTEQKQE